jgi:hypothetical protein
LPAFAKASIFAKATMGQAGAAGGGRMAQRWRRFTCTYTFTLTYTYIFKERRFETAWV